MEPFEALPIIWQLLKLCTLILYNLILEVEENHSQPLLLSLYTFIVGSVDYVWHSQ